MKRFAIVLLSIAMLISFSGCSEKDASVDKDNKVAAINVKVEEVGKTSIADVITYTGEVKASETVSVSSKASASAKEVKVEIGDYVKAGDVLLVLDETDYKLQYDKAVNAYNQSLIMCTQSEATYSQAQAAVGQSEAAYKQAEAAYNGALSTYNSVINGTAKQSEIQLKTALDAAKIEYDNAKLNYDNQKTLYESGAISKSVLDTAETRYNNAKLNYDTAQENYDLTVNVILTENADKAYANVLSAQEAMNSAKAAIESAKVGVESAKVNVDRTKADVANAEIQVQSAKNALDNTVIKAPISGYIATKNTNEGQMVAQGVEIFAIKETKTVDVDINVTEAVVSGLKLGSETSVLVKAVSKEKFEGVITNISPAKDAKTGMYKVTVRIDGVNEVLKDGMFADVEITLAKAAEAVVISADAIMEDKDGTKYVYIAKGDKAKRIDVVAGIITDTSVEIISGISVGDKVIISGKEYLSEKNNDIKIVK